MSNEKNAVIKESIESIIIVPCAKCYQPNSIYVTSKRPIQFCAFCSSPISDVEIYEVRGFVYVLSNVSMPGLLKIGFTQRDINSRVQELGSHAGIPTAFVTEAFYPTDDPIRDEAKVHQILAYYRVENKEFFKLTVQVAVSMMSKIFKFSPIILRDGLKIKNKIRWLKCNTCKWVWTIEYDATDGNCPKCDWHISKRLRVPSES